LLEVRINLWYWFRRDLKEDLSMISFINNIYDMHRKLQTWIRPYSQVFLQHCCFQKTRSQAVATR